jgi:hypothetical protein
VQLAGVAAALLQGVLEVRQCRLDARASERDPAIGVLGNMRKQLGAGGAADQNPRSWLLDGLGPLPAGLEIHELTVKLGDLFRPELLHGQDLLADQRSATLHVDTVVLHLLVVPAVADAENQTPSRDEIKRGELLGEGNRIVLRNQPDRGTQPDPLGQCGRGTQSHVGVEAALVLFTQNRVPGWRRRSPADGDVGVLGDVKRVEASVLGLLGQLNGAHGQVRCVHRDADLHDGS